MKTELCRGRDDNEANQPDDNRPLPAAFALEPGPGRAHWPHAGVFLGGNALTTTTCDDSQGEFDLRFNPGLLGSAVAGWDFGPGNPAGEGRIELEYTHRINRLDKARFADGVAPAGGNLTADSMLINFYGVSHDKDRSWSPYAGAGIGAARVAASDLTVTGGPLSSDSAVVFAYQFGVGIDYALTNRLNLDWATVFSTAPAPDSAKPTDRTSRWIISTTALFSA